MSGVRAMRGMRAGALGLTILSLAGCGDREGSEHAALTLAEAIYPGELEFYDSYLQKGYYDVALVKKGDPLTRIRFNIDADPANCQAGTACEDRLRRAYGMAVSSGVKLKAINSTFSHCGIPLLGIHEAQITTTSRIIVELDLDPVNQQPALDRLVPCIAAFRQALPDGADAAQRTLAFRILRPSGRPALPVSLSLDSRLPGKRADEASYQISVDADRDRPLAADLRLYANYVRSSGLDEKMAEAARRKLAKDQSRAHVPKYTLNWQLKLDPERLDVIRTYVLACSTYTAGEGPCRTDLAISMRYDLDADEASEMKVIRGITDQKGAISLPDLPGR